MWIAPVVARATTRNRTHGKTTLFPWWAGSVSREMGHNFPANPLWNGVASSGSLRGEALRVGASLNTFGARGRLSVWGPPLFSPGHLACEPLCVSHHTACRFAEKTRFFRSLRAGRPRPCTFRLLWVAGLPRGPDTSPVKARWGRDGGPGGKGNPRPRRRWGFPSPRTGAARGVPPPPDGSSAGVSLPPGRAEPVRRR